MTAKTCKLRPIVQSSKYLPATKLQTAHVPKCIGQPQAERSHKEEYCTDSNGEAIFSTHVRVQAQCKQTQEHSTHAG